MISPLQVSGYSCSSVVPTVYYIPVFGTTHSGSSNVQGFQTARYSCAHMPVSVAHRNRKSVDYIADTTLRFLSSVSALFYGGSTFRIRVINQ